MACPVRFCCAIMITSVLLAPAAEGALTDRFTASPPAVDADLVAAARGARISLDQAVSMVLGRYGGKVIRAESRTRNGRTIHSIKLLTDDGRVRTVQVDGETGQIS
jgi:uncharacterized iron-regulated membrane protein